MKISNWVISALLLVGIVDQINDDAIIVEYEEGNQLKYSEVSLSQSACVPTEGMTVYFFKDYKIVTCGDT